MLKRMLVLLLAAVVFGGLIIYSQFRPKPMRVSGVIEADEIRLGSRLGGRVAKVSVEEGQPIKAGEVLLELEPYDLLQREREAQATLAARTAEYDRLRRGFREEEKQQARARHSQFQARLELLEAGARQEDKEAARGRLEAAEATFKLASQDYKRITSLAQTSAATQQELDKATEEYNAARSMRVVRQQELALLEAGSRPEEIREAKARVEEAWQAVQLAERGFREEEIEQARAAQDAAQAALDAIFEQKKELQLLSPCDGTVEALELQRGDLVAAGAPVLAVMNLERLWVRTYVPEGLLEWRVGQSLAVTIDSLPGETLRGEVTFISRQAEFTPSNVQTPEERAKQVFRVKVGLPPGDPRLRPGMSADVWLREPAPSGDARSKSLEEPSS